MKHTKPQFKKDVFHVSNSSVVVFKFFFFLKKILSQGLQFTVEDQSGLWEESTQLFLFSLFSYQKLSQTAFTCA